MKVNSQLERAQIENVTSLPTAGTVGRMVFNTTDGKHYVDDGTAYRAILRNDGKAVVGTNATAANNTRFHRGANGLLQVVVGSDTTAEGTLSTAIAQLSARNENYALASIPTFGNAGRMAYITDTGFLEVDTGTAWKVLADTSSTQTLTGKSLTDPTMTASNVYTQIATPGAPSAGFTKIYSKSDGKFYYQGSDGVEHAIGSGSGGSGKNYAPNDGNFESGTTGYSLFNTTLTSLVPTGSITAGAASFTTFNTTTTGKLGDLASLQIAATSAFAAGAGVITDVMNVDLQDRNSNVLTFKMKYSITAGNANINVSGTSANTFQPYIYDVTNSVWIQPVGVYSMIVGTGVGEISGSFQTSAAGTQYRLALICINASAGAATLLLDNWNIGPSASVLSAGVVDFVGKVTSNQTLAQGVTDLPLTAVKDSYAAWTGSAYKVPVSGDYQFNLHLVYSTAISNNLFIYVNGVSTRRLGTSYSGVIVIGSCIVENLKAGDLVSVRSPDAGCTVNADTTGTFSLMRITSAAGESSEGRPVVMTAQAISGSLTSSFNTITTWTQNLIDTNAAFSGGGTYTVPVTGYYEVTAGITNNYNAADTVIAVQISQNGAGVATGWADVRFGAGGCPTASVSKILSCKAGDTITIQGYSGGTSDTISSTAGRSNLSITRISGASANQSATPPSVNMRYAGTVSTISASNGLVVLSTKSFASGNDYSAGVFTAPISGKYSVTGSMNIGFSSATAGNSSYSIYIYKNGSLYSQNFKYALVSSAAQDIVQVTDIIPLNAGDTISMYASNNATGPSIANDVNRTYLSIARLGN